MFCFMWKWFSDEKSGMYRHCNPRRADDNNRVRHSNDVDYTVSTCHPQGNNAANFPLGSFKQHETGILNINRWRFCRGIY
jgi:hypothetical protein